MQSNGFPHVCFTNLIQDVPLSHSFPPSPCLLHLSLLMLFHTSLYPSTSVVFCYPPATTKSSPFFFKVQEILCQKHSEVPSFEFLSSSSLPDSLEPVSLLPAYLATYFSSLLPQLLSMSFFVYSGTQLLPSMCHKELQLACLFCLSSGPFSHPSFHLWWKALVKKDFLQQWAAP